jgi:hypothetical protein
VSSSATVAYYVAFQRFAKLPAFAFFLCSWVCDKEGSTRSRKTAKACFFPLRRPARDNGYFIFIIHLFAKFYILEKLCFAQALACKGPLYYRLTLLTGGRRPLLGLPLGGLRIGRTICPLLA